MEKSRLFIWLTDIRSEGLMAVYEALGVVSAGNVPVKAIRWGIGESLPAHGFGWRFGAIPERCDYRMQYRVWRVPYCQMAEDHGYWILWMRKALWRCLWRTVIIWPKITLPTLRIMTSLCRSGLCCWGRAIAEKPRWIQKWDSNAGAGGKDWAWEVDISVGFHRQIS